MSSDQTPEPLTRQHLETFAFDPHRAAEQEVQAMARELIDARGRITELEAGRDMEQTMLRNAADRIVELEAALAPIARIHVEPRPGSEAWPIVERVHRGWQSGAHHYPDSEVLDVTPIVADGDGTRAVAARSVEERCSGDCLTGADLGASPENGGWMIAQADPECPAHGDQTRGVAAQPEPVGYVVGWDSFTGGLVVNSTPVPDLESANVQAGHMSTGNPNLRVFELWEVRDA